jgi:small subunit ribosomal protein S10
MTEQKVRIKIKSFDHKLADQAVRHAVERTGAIVVGPVPLPTHIEKFCVIRGPNIDKDSREQFEIRTHKRVIDVLQPSSKTIDALSQLDLASGVEIDIKL